MWLRLVDRDQIRCFPTARICCMLLCTVDADKWRRSTDRRQATRISVRVAGGQRLETTVRRASKDEKDRRNSIDCMADSWKGIPTATVMMMMDVAA